ncbi:HEAT repeat domain-containing protein [Planctomicrobium sp. SH664]|uniref:HEAT repeat domain-containing protein n=1 Tax=Planctomicrobium sp. SH664 TaxID=3448125 RepID=UPI003F5C7C4F
MLKQYLRKSRIWGVVLLNCGLAGCGASPAATDVPEDRSAVMTVRSEHEPAKTAELSTGVLNVRSAPQPTPTSDKASALFQKLVTPGVELAEWEAAQQELVNLGPETVPFLGERLQSGDFMEREMAATLLALFGPQAAPAVKALTGALQDDSEFVRGNAAAALVQCPDHTAAATSTLIQLLESADPQLRQMAAMNLSGIGPEAIPHLDSLKKILAQENPPEVTRLVIELLGRIGPPAEPAVPQLRQIKFEQSGELGTAASQAIELIETQAVSAP